MNSAASFESYDDESSYDFESPLAASSPYLYSTSSSTRAGSSGSLDEDEEDEEDEGEGESSESEDSDETGSPSTATLSPTSPTFHPTGLSGPAFAGAFASPAPEQPAVNNKSYPLSYSSFSNYPATAAPRLQVPRPPVTKRNGQVPPPPLPHHHPNSSTPRPHPGPAAHRDAAPAPTAPPPRVTPKVTVRAPPPAPPPPPPPPMARSKSSTISHLRDAISSLESQMSALLARKRELQAKLEQEVRVQSPVHRLPSELLSSIFAMGVLGVGEEEENPVMLGTIMLVCRQWNEVALDAPKLWAKVSVSPHDSILRAKRRLDRSKSSPLDISINFGPRAEYTTTTTTYAPSAPANTGSSSASQSSGSSASGNIQHTTGVSSSSASGSTSSSYVSTNPLIINRNNTNNNSLASNAKTTTTTTNVIDAIIRSMELFKLVLWRTRSFTLRVPNRQQAHAALLRCRDYPAPILEHLTIHIYHSMLDGPSEVFTAYGGGGVQSAVAGAKQLTPFPLFNGQTPLLRTCSFTSFNFGWEPSMVRRLRVLRLGGYFNGYAPSVPALLGVLRECPELEELSLRNLTEGEGDHAGLSGHHGGMGGFCPPDMGFGSRGCSAGSGGALSTEASSSASTHAANASMLPSKLIHLPKLHSLTLYYASPAHSLLPWLSTPSLTNLTLAFLQNISTILQCFYTQALTKLPLKTMRIESCVFNEIVFINLMKRLNGLVKLEMVDVEDLSGGVLRSLTALTPSTPSPLPRVTQLTLDGCTSLDFDSLRIFVESRLPPNPETFKRFHTNPKDIVSSASEAAKLAEVARQTRARHSTATGTASASASGHVNGGGCDLMMHPARLLSVDVTRCTQISKEMVQWLRMYVAEVKCESVKGVWGDT